MATQKSRTSAGSKSAKSRMRRRMLTAAAVGVAAGVATMAVSKGLETPRGRALKKKALSKGRKLGRNVLGDVEKAAVASAMANMPRPAGAGAAARTPSGTQRAARKSGGTKRPARKTSGTRRPARKSGGTKSAARKTASRAR
jgi:hypothetical protein